VPVALAAGVLGLALLAVPVVLHRWWRDRRSRQQEETLRRGLVDLWSCLAGEFAAGRPPATAWPAAMSAVDPLVAGELASVAAAVALGLDPADRLRRLSAPGAESAQWVAAVTVINSRRGGAQAAALRRIAAAARAEVDQRARQEALLAGGRATTRVLTGLPIFGLLLGTAFGAQPLSFLLGTSVGRGCLAAALALLFAGRWWATQVISGSPASSRSSAEPPLGPAAT
jgi:tight adherence protein B